MLQDAFSQLESQYKTQENEETLLQMRVLLGELNKKQRNIGEAQRLLEAIAQGASEIKISQTSNTIAAPMNNIPHEVRSEINADIQEIQKTFNAGCFRSTVILCGRVLEVALHRKYFDATGKDLLVTSPGLGLGKLIAKLSEANIKFDPGLSQQIHLTVPYHLTIQFLLYQKIRE